MARSTTVLAVLAVLIVACGASIPGGWSTKDPQSSPKYKELAHYAVSQRVEGLENYDTVLELTKVETQVVAGLNYRLTFTIAGSECKIAEIEYSEERCPPKDNVGKATCTAVVYERPWQNIRSLTSFNCQ
uniref:Cystatin domain-containing protein n=1 Tax=Amblyomma maculatum TaxID=34609 RepID=G3MRH4_AMBMU